LIITKPHLAIVGLTIITIILIYYYYYEIVVLREKQPEPEPQEVITPEGKDIFGVNEIYPTAKNGREWFIDMEDPLNDKSFSITSDVPIVKNVEEDGLSWSINDTQIRMNVDTPDSIQPWKNIEMTGYVKIMSVYDTNQEDREGIDSGDLESLAPDLTWRARGGSHNSQNPCEGTALNGGIDVVNMEASWKKEIWHTGGYTDSKGSSKATENALLDRWIGWKTIMYNFNNDTSVKMESYIDGNSDNVWKKVNEVTDEGGWFANSSDEEFSSANCNKAKDYVITNSGPIASFRADNIAFDFKNLSIREIEPA
jgi:hypothetical protein